MFWTAFRSYGVNVKVEVEPIKSHSFQTRREGEAHEQIVAKVSYHFVLKMSDVLDQVSYSGVVVEGWSRELSRKLTL